MPSFTHIFTGIGNAGARIVNSITTDGVVRVTINPAYYLLPRGDEYEERIRRFFSSLPKDTFLWLIFEDKDVESEIRDLIIESTPQDTVKLAYVLTPNKELVQGKKPGWAEAFETVFYDSLWEFLGKNVPVAESYELASRRIAEMFSRLYYYLESQMLVNIDYADLFNMIKGGNVGIIRLLERVNFDWHWGLWDRGLIGILVGPEFPLKEAHEILRHFQEILEKKDVIWGIITDDNLKDEVEILSLLVKGW
jgi:cell division GTPase FtsZ